MLVESFDDQILFNLLQGFGQVLLSFRSVPYFFGFLLSEVKGKVLGGDDFSPAEDDRSFDEILQLSDIPGIGVAEEEHPRFFGDI